MNGVLITGGELPEYKYVKKYLENAYICVADSGFDWVLKNNVDFDHIVGDMDSIINKKYLDEVDPKKITILPKDKDDTDTIFGLKFLKNIGVNNVTLIGGGGGRLDHLLGIVSIFETELAPKQWVTHNEVIFFVSGYFNLDNYIGYNISVYPLGAIVCRIESFGLKWDLNMVDWNFKSVGISNYIQNKNAWINTGDNNIMLILPIKGRNFE